MDEINLIAVIINIFMPFKIFTKSPSKFSQVCATHIENALPMVY